MGLKIRGKQDLIDLLRLVADYDERFDISFTIPSYYLLKLDKQLWYERSQEEYPHTKIPEDKVVVKFGNVVFTIHGDGNYDVPEIKIDEHGNSYIEK